ncbi:DUF1294 domain-containing protein [Paragemmobacter straminiformis]|uniref:DUF1294 domain-containing protein n=1 Tax=Paragemmobacter straminiformis TaxID=2045119 RepID=A0A842I6C7_9RHOB|nr:DUF1294 domain-containing protein [Gemmobacter straminiformis]MBC2834963.1 DUF1294 domain-containing protein [Gemmobacter straminiformis]
MMAPGSVGFLAVCLAGYVLVASVLAYVAFAIDKGRAERGESRIPEATLLTLALFGGWPGAKLAQRRLRHKTRKPSFAGTLNLIGLGQAAFLAALLVPLEPVSEAMSNLTLTNALVALQIFEPSAETEKEQALPRRFGPGTD